MNTTEEEFDYQAFMNEGIPKSAKIHRGNTARESRRKAAEGRHDQSGELRRIFQIFQEIGEFSDKGDYIYRGEPEHYSKVSSSLYREWSKIDNHINVTAVQKEILKEAKRFVSYDDEFEILTQLQHYGGATNLIDFSTDYHIALFFACDGSDLLEKDGRVILLQKTREVNTQFQIPQNPKNRVISQKSIFIMPHNGFIEPDHIINVPKDLKIYLLNYLWKCHGLSTATIYNDLHGFIKFQKVHTKWNSKYYSALVAQNRGDDDKAIEHYSEAIKLNPRFADAYCNRGTILSNKGLHAQAIDDYTKAIELDPEDGDFYLNRGIAQANKGAYDLAIEDYNKSLELNPHDAYVHLNRGVAKVSMGALELAIEDYNKALELNPNFAEAYFNRGTANFKQGNYDPAVQDYTKTIELAPKDANAYFYRGVTWLPRKNWSRAKSDLTAAKNLGIDIPSEFRNNYKNLEGFQKQFEVRLPEDIVAMLMT